jgi:hypothetical protein
MMSVGESIDVGSTTIKIIVDPKHYEPYEILNEYVDPWFALTPLH